ncbi:hypothetical protein [Limnobacter parvus]|uniref:Uncharacterized protein n=1 Tax=Limnobacter parvus TaxID=2939690 RepID=A0ABT1XFL0_9BURK|nr:hypothetical protein [Limnobacter parvus]MCR2745934.1 hypothetical protein [Limnobacter parvus]
MPINTGNVGSAQLSNPTKFSNWSLPATESELVATAGSLAVDLIVSSEEPGPLPPLGKLSHSACCYDHLKFLKAKLNTLSTMHRIGMCHGSVDSEHFFTPKKNESACQWRHAETTAFYQDDEFYDKYLNDILAASAGHVPDAHVEAVLEQSPVRQLLEELTQTLSSPWVDCHLNLAGHVDQVITHALTQLEIEQRQFGENQEGRGNSWIKNLQHTSTKEGCIYSHPTDPFYPHIKEWRIANKDQGRINELTNELNTDFETKKENTAMPRVIAWVQFEESEQQVIRAAYGAAT